jgi:hypothetical protein
MKSIRTQITCHSNLGEVFGIDYKELFVTGEICNMGNYPVIAWTRTFDPTQIIHRKLKLTFEGMTVTIYPKKYSINMDATC